jgi:hypothetical protein
MHPSGSSGAPIVIKPIICEQGQAVGVPSLRYVPRLSTSRTLRPGPLRISKISGTCCDSSFEQPTEFIFEFNSISILTFMLRSGVTGAYYTSNGLRRPGHQSLHPTTDISPQTVSEIVTMPVSTLLQLELRAAQRPQQMVQDQTRERRSRQEEKSATRLHS